MGSYSHTGVESLAERQT